MESRLIFRHYGLAVISEEGTETGRSAGQWSSRCKPVGGSERQIPLVSHTER